MYDFDDYETMWYDLHHDALLENFNKAYDSGDLSSAYLYESLLDEMEDSPVEWLASHPVPDLYVY